jgi:hypothetical protein
LSLEAALIANSSVVLFPKLLSSVQPTPARQGIFWKNMRTYLKYARLKWLILAATHIGLWKQTKVETLLLSVSLVVLFPEVLVSKFRLRSTARALWLKLVRPSSAPKAPVQLDEPSPYYWNVIGECYVHGMMDGEAITFQNNNNIKPQTFELR